MRGSMHAGGLAALAAAAGVGLWLAAAPPAVGGAGGAGEVDGSAGSRDPRDPREADRHWAFVKPARHTPPRVARAGWPRNPIDRFILARLETEGLDPAPSADRHTLIRRLSLDLTGLPPTPQQVQRFVHDPSPEAYERLVDRLLESPGYGERWARLWLDLARYADTQGYEKDNRREIWRYRDWVIDAFNRNTPFDRFTVEQLAGDLLPEPTTDQLIATAFHRNTMTNTEGGTDDEEFRIAAVKDRIATTAQVWMGLTLNCAECHDHKYDPITQRQYYRFLAFFNQTADNDQPDERPVIEAPTPAVQRRIERIEARIAELENELHRDDPALDAAQAEWEKTLETAPPVEIGPWRVLGPFTADSAETAFHTAYPPEQGVDLNAAYRDGELEWTKRPDWKDGEVQMLSGDNAATYLYRTLTAEQARPLALSLGSDDAIKVWLNGEPVLSKLVYRGVEPDQERITLRLGPGENKLLMKIVNGAGGYGFYFKAKDDALPPDLRRIVRTPAEQRTDEQKQQLRRHYRSVAPQLQPLRDRIADLAESKPSPPTVPIMMELPPEKRRRTHIMKRGNFLSPGEEVEPGVPDAFHDWPADAPRNRLGVARWLVHPDNPLTARVTVNRLWAQLFGIGLVETQEDFGTQGTPPSHPKLLDWLAAELVRRDWDIKSMLRMMVTSATYRQASAVRPELQERDPGNRLLARGPRFRLPAEMIRDQALAVSGLLSELMHGPSVMPPQPEGVWQVVYSGDKWVAAEGPDRYRRGLYTFWRRTSPHPAMTTFDAPSREVCTVRRIRTNTPLQALVTLNDPQFVEAAQALARRIIESGGSTAAQRLHHAFLRTLARPPSEAEAQRLSGLLETEMAHYRGHPEDATAMATDPLGPLPDGMDPAEAAAWTVIANVLLNLDEFLTKG